MQSLHLFELGLINYLQMIRSPLLDKFFLFLNFFDTFYFPLLLIPIVWMGYNWKWGLKIFYLLIISYLTNELAKCLFAQPRPFELDPNVGIIFLKNYGFPSGAAQSATIYAGLLISNLKNKKIAWALGLNIIFWICLSRVYLGVHFISDIIGGITIGFFLVLLFNYFAPKAQAFLSGRSLSSLLLINFLVSSFIFLVDINFGREMGISCFLVGIGLIISERFDLFLPQSRSVKEGCFKVALYFLGVSLLIFSVLKLFPGLHKDKGDLFFISSVITAIWLSLGVNFIWIKGFYNLKVFKK